MADPIRRWTPVRKAQVLQALQRGAVSRAQILHDHGLTDEELDGWAEAFRTGGARDLRVTQRRGAR